MKRTINSDEYGTLCLTIYQLAEILLSVGVVELKISKKEKEIFWDTENKGQIDPKELEKLNSIIEKYYFDLKIREIEK